MSSSHDEWPCKSGLRIGHLNVNHAHNKIPEISSILENSGKNFHVFGLSETRLKKEISNTELNIPGYSIIRRDPIIHKETGLAIYIHNSVNFRHVPHLEQHHIESVWLEVCLKNSPPVLIGFCYRNPSERSDWKERFTAMMDAVCMEAKEILLLGDLNIDLLRQNAPWINLINMYHLRQVITRPTRVTANSESLIDHIYVSDMNNVIEHCVPVSACSDHYPVCLTWSRKGAKIPTAGHKTTTYRSFTNFDENRFIRDLIASPLSMVYNLSDPNDATEYWIKTFSDVYNKHAPFKTKRVRQKAKPKWLSADLQKAIHLRDLLKKQGHHEESKKLRNKINSQKRAAKKKYFQDLLSSKTNSKSVWSAINQLTNRNQCKNSAVPDEVSAEDLNIHFTSVADQVIQNDCSASNNLRLLREFCTSKGITSELTFPPITVVDVYHTLVHLKQTGTRDLEGLDSKILKLSAPIIVDTLTYIYNLCIRKNCFPKVFKIAKVIPIYKHGAKTNTSNYRPISVLSLLSKPLEKHMHKQMLKHLNDNRLLHPNQSGFRENHSCQTALTHLVDHWLHNINSNKFNGVLFVDFRKAFDVISHDLLLRKLSIYGVSSSTLAFLSSYLTGRHQCVHAHSRRSSLLRLKHGVPQGSVLGPLLFSVYVNDLPLYLQALCELFADDTTIHTSSTDINVVHDTLQNSIHELVKWTEQNHMSLHPGKTTWMLVTTRQKRQNLTVSLPAILMHNQVIEETTTHKVLGVFIDNNLSWSPHITHLCKVIPSKVFQLSKVKYFLNFHARKLFFQAHIQSCLDYGSTLWDSACVSTLKPLVSLHRRALKLILLKSSPLTDADYKTLCILPLKLRFELNKGTFMFKIMSGRAPAYLKHLFLVNRSRGMNKISISIPRIDLFKSSLTYSGAVLWNSLPESLKKPISTSSFKRKFLTHLNARVCSNV